MEYYNNNEIYINGKPCPHGESIYWEGHFTTINVGDINCVGACHSKRCAISGDGTNIQRFAKPEMFEGAPISRYNYPGLREKQARYEEEYRKEIKKLYGNG